MGFLPLAYEDLSNNGALALDFVLVTGDAYVDHPSFGAAVISRLLESKGFSVGIIAQPNWKDKLSFTRLGRPGLGFLVTGGNIDSMVNHYTAAKKIRSKDLYSPGGKMGLRPDRASIVYCNKIRENYKDIPIILGGLEASLRRLGHYDYWDDKVRRSILLDSSANIIVYGMGEKQIVEIAENLKVGVPIEQINYVKGTAYKSKECPEDAIILPSFKSASQNKEVYACSFMIQYKNTDSITAKTLAEHYGDVYIIQNSPQAPLSSQEFDRIYALPFERTYHPVYEKDGGVPAIEEVKFSIISNRGCFGGCSFCALTFHQGRIVQSRSHISIMQEAEKITWDQDFKGYIHDVGGPTANFRKPACKKQQKEGVCDDRQCLFPVPCPKLEIDHSDYISLLRKLREIPNVKKVFVRSGIRYDYAIYDKDDQFIKELCKHHISGQLKVAPEHVSPKVLSKMGKPSKEVYLKFVEKYYKINKKLEMNQFLVPYLMSSHPGSDIEAAIELSLYLKELGYTPEQVQDFYPTPGTLSTAMFHTGLDPRTMEKVYVPKSKHEKAIQRALIQYRLPQNYNLVKEGLIAAGREDLIGFGKDFLISPRNWKIKETGNKKFVKEGVKVENQKTTDKPKNKKAIRNIHKKKI